jgi:hypothetical protein
MIKKCCPKCEEEVDIELFSKNRSRKDGLSRICKICQRLYVNAHYQANKEYYSKKARKQDKELLDWYKKYKMGLACEKCGENHPACIDFHHRDSSKKDIEVANAIRKSWCKDRILREIAKCDVLCSNCHRKEHYTPVA